VPEHETKMEEINYKFAPITSCEVERSFSKYKSILVDNGQCFKIENLEQYIVCNVCKYKYITNKLVGRYIN
jgi:hypothetical protein